LLAGVAVGLFVVAPIWWVPTSWRVSNHPPELHQDLVQLFVGNSFFFAMLAFLMGVAVMLVRRSGLSRRGRAPDVLDGHTDARHESVPLSRGRRPETALEGGVGRRGSPVVVGATDAGGLRPTNRERLELVGYPSSAGPAG
jgi:hypothetical protein